MGAYLSKPKTEKISDGSTDGKLSYGVSCMQGWRVSMEASVYLNRLAFTSPRKSTIPWSTEISKILNESLCWKTAEDVD